MRIMQVNNSMPTRQSNPTFKSKDSSLRELFTEASLLFEEEVGTMERALQKPPKSVDEALLRYPFHPEELERQEVLALAHIERTAKSQAEYELQAEEAIKRIHAPRLVGRFSDKLVETFKAVLDKAVEVLTSGSKEPNDVRALVASKRFFNFNAELLRTERNHELSMDAWRKVINVEHARPDLDAMFKAEEK